MFVLIVICFPLVPVFLMFFGEIALLADMLVLVVIRCPFRPICLMTIRQIAFRTGSIVLIIIFRPLPARPVTLLGGAIITCLTVS